MPPEGPNKSEELLKRYAKERQEQAPNLPLHPATRRLLQGEVTREFGKRSALDKRRWSAWFGIMRGRLAIGTALGVVGVTGVCIWWNNQEPRPMEMAKAERSANEVAMLPQSGVNEVKLKAEKQIAAGDALTRVPSEDEVRRPALAPSSSRAIRPASKSNVVVSASVETVTTRQSTFALYDAPSLATAAVSFSESSLGRGQGVKNSGDFGLGLAGVSREWAIATTAAPPVAMGFDSGTLSTAVPRTFYAGGAGDGKAATNWTDLSLAYNQPNDGLSPVPPSASLPSLAFNFGNDESKNLSKLSDAAKLAPGQSGALARNEGGAVDQSRRAALDAQAPAAPATAPVQPATAIGETAAADKRQPQLAASESRGDVVGQSTTTSPKTGEQLARFSRQPVATTDVVSKQKALRGLERSDADSVVLNRFVIEQQGNSVRVVDADGSVYDGKVEEPVVAEFDDEKLAEKKDQLAPDKSVSLQSGIAPRTDGYSFRASGSNVTLRQMVVVNGRFSTATDNTVGGGTAAVNGGVNTLPASAPAPTRKSGVISNRAAIRQQPGFGGTYGFTTNQPATIEGTVRIGVTNQQWFRAVRDSR